MRDPWLEGLTGALTTKLERRRALRVLGSAAVGSALSALSGRAQEASISYQAAGEAHPISNSRTISSQDPTEDRPNFIFIVTDDLDAASLAWMPNISALLRREGTTCTNFFATDPSCGPSRASILRGQYVHNHGVLGNEGEFGGFSRFHRLDREESTIATWLHDAGYRTGFIGKYLNEYPVGARDDHVPPGWDEWYGLITTQYFGYQFNDNGIVGRAGRKSKDYQTDTLSRRAQAFITRASSAHEPFFVYIGTKAPHDPPIPPPRYEGAFADLPAPRTAAFNEVDISDKPDHVRLVAQLDDRQISRIDENFRQRLRTMLAVDDMIADLVGTLRAAGLLDKTYIIFTSDNGYFFGEHRLSHGKGLPYDESLRIPLIVRGPGVARDRMDSRLSNNADLAPTIADLAGVDVPDFVDGRSLRSLLTGEEESVWRQISLVEDIAKLFKKDAKFRTSRESEQDGDDDLKTGRRSVPAYRALRGVDWLYVDYATGERELYDLESDPHQLENLATIADPLLMDRFAVRLQELAECAGGECRAAEDIPLNLTGLG
jgi:N-acetylglucosamine-6-sulfatase